VNNGFGGMWEGAIVTYCTRRVLSRLLPDDIEEYTIIFYRTGFSLGQDLNPGPSENVQVC
jgi:hypothetical protein